MAEAKTQTPESVIDVNDNGDETTARFRFQWAHAAVITTMLLDAAESSIEVYCEHHEDILIKHRDGSYSGLQVKTRATNQPKWKTSDEDVLK